MLPADGRGPLFPGASEVSPRTQELVDEEVRRIVDEHTARSSKLLKDNRGRLDGLAQALLEHETLDEDAAYAAAGVEHAASGAGELEAAASARV